MKNFTSIIIGGTGQFGIHMSQLLQKKNFKVFITSRNYRKKRNLKKFIKNGIFIKLNIYNKKNIKKVLKKN